MSTIFMNMENSKMSEPHKFVLTLLQKLNLRSSIKHAALENLSVCYMWKYIRNNTKTINLK